MSIYEISNNGNNGKDGASGMLYGSSGECGESGGNAGTIDLFLSCINNQDLKIELFNLMGKKIFSTKTNEHKTKINFNENLRGVYQLVIEGNNFKENKKIVFN